MYIDFITMSHSNELVIHDRPSWEEYFINIAELTSLRSNCIKRRVGCIIVKDNRILSLGYNGTPAGTTNCYQGGCKRCMDQYTRTCSNDIHHTDSNNISHAAKHLDLCMCLHAEENAILFVSRADLVDSTIYVTLIPCISCVKKIIQCQIKIVYYIHDYSPDLDPMSRQILLENGIRLIKWNKSTKN